MGEFTHFNQHGDAIMVDISKKAETAREAIDEGRISMNQECFDQLKAGSPPPPGTSQCYSRKIL